MRCVHSVRTGCTAVAPERLAGKDEIQSRNVVLVLDFGCLKQSKSAP